MDLEDALSQIPMFASLDRKHLRELSRVMHAEHFPAGNEVLREGQSGMFGEMGIVLNGLLRVTRGDGETLGHVGPGQFFGEMAVVDSLPRSATLIAEEPTDAAVMKAWHLKAVIREHPEIAMELLNTLSKRLRDAEARAAS